ncbi:MAG: Txe/YoeB family addiction module toxin [Clostridiales bacterium]|nr:Txe/YoeB family addiction module toxin [Clostridiales bacterium]
MLKVFSETGWDDYLYWQTTDKKMQKKINDLIKNIERTPFAGIGKPEPLKHDLSGYWSRRISGEHRLIYAVEDGKIYIVACRYHY